MTTSQSIPVLRSLFELEGTSRPVTTLPITSEANLYLTAQEVRWTDQEVFAVGRSDGSVTLYTYEPKRTPALRIKAALAEQDSGGVRMIVSFGDGRCASSNGPECVNIWHVDDPSSTLIHLTYDGALQSATAGHYLTSAEGEYLIIGHDSGFVTTWSVNADGIDLLRVVDLRSPKPVNPWGLQTIYGIAAVPGAANIVTAADNGDLCVIDPVAGRLVSKTLYDQSAQRGLNDVSILGKYVATVNCGVGSAQPNLWLFQVQADYSLKLLDSTVLRKDSSLHQVFAFSVCLSQDSKGPVWFVATEEGLLWSGRIVDDRLTILGNELVASHYGAALAVQDDVLLVAGDGLHVYGID